MSDIDDQPIVPIIPPEQLSQAFPDEPELVEASALIDVDRARQDFDVDGAGLSAAVLDTGLRVTHADFLGRVQAQRNFTSNNGGDENNASDGNGHGTNVAGIIAAGPPGPHLGMAPKAGVIPLKVLDDAGRGGFSALCRALDWVLANAKSHNIAVVCMSLGGAENYTSDEALVDEAVAKRIKLLREQHVATVVAAGNAFFTHGSAQGMSYPAIVRESVSVGAVYDASIGCKSYHSGAKAHSTRPDQITPFSQRLHPSVAPVSHTDIFAPGSPITSTGISGDNAGSTQDGTSQAAPVIAGVILLMQQLHVRKTGQRASIDKIVAWLRSTARPIKDDPATHDDNVVNTNLEFLRVDAYAALEAVDQSDLSDYN